MTISKRIFIPVSILCAFAAERWISFLFPEFFFVPPLTVFVISLWFLALSPAAAVFFSFLGGFFLDVMSAFPFGTYTALLLVYAGASAAIRINLAESHKRFALPLWGAIVLFTLPFGVLGIGSIISFLRSIPFHLSVSGFAAALAAAALWAVFYFLLSVGFASGIRRMRRSSRP